MKIRMKNHKARATLFVAAILAVFVCVWQFASVKTTVTEYSFVVGEKSIYELKYSGKNTTRLSLPDGARATGTGEEQLTAAAAIDGQLAISVLSSAKGQYLLAMELEHLSESHIEFLGKTVFLSEDQAREQLVGHRTYVKTTRQGKIEEIHFAPETPEIWKTFSQTLIGDLQFVLSSGEETWETQERTALGLSENVYRVDDEERGHYHVDKRRNDYSFLKAVPKGAQLKEKRVEGNYKAIFGSLGRLERIAGNERVDALGSNGETILASHSQIEAVYVRREKIDVDTREADQILSSNKGRKLGEVIIPQDSRIRALEERIKGMTFAELSDDFSKYASSGQFPSHGQWIWRATGLLEQRPELCRKLAAQFEDPAIGANGRLAMAELFVSVGHKEAQAVLRELLSRPNGTAHPILGGLIQRLMFLEHPEPLTVKLVKEHFAQSADSSDLKYAVAHTLGGMAKSLAQQGETKRSDQVSSLLVAALEESETAEERAVYLSSLGNCGDLRQVDRIAAFAKDQSGNVRKEVALALRHTQNRESESVVLGYLDDEDFSVQRAALQVLDQFRLEAEHLERVAQLAESDGLKKRNRSLVVKLLGNGLVSGGDGEAASRRALKNLLGRDLEARERRHIRQLLNRRPA